MGLVILTLIKIIIYIISRREVKEWEKERNKTAITCVSISCFGALGWDVSIKLHVGMSVMIWCDLMCILIFTIFAHSECPTPVPLWVVIVSIVGGILAVGLALLIALKIIIMILQRIEYNDFVKNKVVWGEV